VATPDAPHDTRGGIPTSGNLHLLQYGPFSAYDYVIVMPPRKLIIFIPPFFLNIIQ
jgi:hypothetical protein